MGASVWGSRFFTIAKDLRVGKITGNPATLIECK